MSDKESPRFGQHDVELEVCGREIGDGVCGSPAVVWVHLDGDEWSDHQATACREHADELLAYPGARLTSDVPLVDADVEAHR